jgi:putative flavoprotein involved in K+ transport
MEAQDIVIVGGGSAGLATGALPRRAGIESLIVEAGPEPGAAWRERYDRLRLHTPRLLSGLPGKRIPRRFGRWVARDGVLEYLSEYAAAEGLDVRTGTRVKRIERDGDAWRLDTGEGAIRARDVIVATGYNGSPFTPEWPGRESFTGELVRSADYRNPQRYRGRDVLVIGVGNSGAEIATDVAEGGAAAHETVGAHAPADPAPRDRRHPGSADRDRDPQGAAVLG